MVDNYRQPTSSDTFYEWADFKKANKTDAFEILEDFNSDGLEDEAWILPHISKKDNFAIVAFLKVKNSENNIDYRVFKLDELDGAIPQQFALDIAEPSKKIWETACGKGYRECQLGEPAEIQITQPSIMFCKIESACSVFMWDEKKKVFNKISLSE